MINFGKSGGSGSDGGGSGSDGGGSGSGWKIGASTSLILVPVPTFCSFNGLWFDYIDSADYAYKYAPMQSIFHCDYFTFNHRYYDYIASPKFKNNFCNSIYEIGIYPAFLLQSTLQFCFALSLFLSCY